TGLDAQQTNMDVIANNLANVSTNGFKRQRAVFEDLLYQTIRQNVDVNLSYERGNTFMFGVTLRTNFNDLRPAYHDNSHPQYRPQPQ
ncbi:flagellar basal body protein, partial [Salmonella enterica subsp. enterica serovar Virginia]|nr:flagellar basal body protein [Salmonella enterica subsp. enterica serovar Virginia]